MKPSSRVHGARPLTPGGGPGGGPQRGPFPTRRPRRYFPASRILSLTNWSKMRMLRAMEHVIGAHRGVQAEGVAAIFFCPNLDRMVQEKSKS